MKERLKNESLQQQLYNALTGAILQGDFPPGRAIPSIADLASEYQVSRTTVRAVLERLKKERLIRPRNNRPALVTLPARLQKNLRIGVVCYSRQHCDGADKFEYSSGPFGWLLYRSILLYAKSDNVTCSIFDDFNAESIRHFDGIIGIGGDENFYRQLCDSGKIFVNISKLD